MMREMLADTCDVFHQSLRMKREKLGEAFNVVQTLNRKPLRFRVECATFGLLRISFGGGSRQWSFPDSVGQVPIRPRTHCSKCHMASAPHTNEEQHDGHQGMAGTRFRRLGWEEEWYSYWEDIGWVRISAVVMDV